jgi:NADH-quinone oxidoreductase subunit J
MIVTVTFAALAALALIGAGGLILCRRVAACALSFLLCITSLGGLYLLLDLQFVAAIQLTASVGLTGAVLIIAWPVSQRRALVRRTLWYAFAAVPLAALACWCIVRGDIRQPILTSPPVWAARDSYLQALGRELIVGYHIPFLLAGVLLLTGIISVTYLLSQRREVGE